MDEAATIFDKIAEVCRHLFSSQELMATLQKPGFMLVSS